MQPTHEIVLPETKPETEWVRGRPLQKVSPTYRHARLQALLASRLTPWAEGRGRVGSEWRFCVAPPDAAVRPLVPDVAYLSYERLSADDDAAAQVPLGAPSVAIEILSPGDRQADVNDKIATYLAAGCDLVLVVDSANEQLQAHAGNEARVFARGDLFQHVALEGFALDVSALFDAARR